MPHLTLRPQEQRSSCLVQVPPKLTKTARGSECKNCPWNKHSLASYTRPLTSHLWGKAGQGSVSTQHQCDVSLFIVVIKYLRKQLKRGRNYFGSHFQRFLSIMAGKVVVQRGSQQSNRKQRERMAVLRLFPFSSFIPSGLPAYGITSPPKCRVGLPCLVRGVCNGPHRHSSSMLYQSRPFSLQSSLIIRGITTNYFSGSWENYNRPWCVH
jgi:hypothetical protein